MYLCPVVSLKLLKPSAKVSDKSLFLRSHDGCAILKLFFIVKHFRGSQKVETVVCVNLLIPPQYVIINICQSPVSFYNIATFLFVLYVRQHAGSQVPSQGSNLCPLKWKHRLLTTECQKSPKLSVFFTYFPLLLWLPGDGLCEAADICYMGYSCCCSVF